MTIEDHDYSMKPPSDGQVKGKDAAWFWMRRKYVGAETITTSTCTHRLYIFIAHEYPEAKRYFMRTRVREFQMHLYSEYYTMKCAANYQVLRTTVFVNRAITQNGY